MICATVRERFAWLAELDDRERDLLADQTAHREVGLFRRLRDEAGEFARRAPR